MKRKIILGWLKKAESDVRSAKILLEAGEVTEATCFHCQQAIEKYLKAFLTERDVRFVKIHDLGTLLELCIENDKDFEKLDKQEIAELTFYAVDLRYPDEFYVPSLQEAKDAYEMVLEVKDFILRKLNIKDREIK